ncbi:RNA polymerase [Jingmen Miniopterus schreibersii paramyxovirus 1]|uniref:RNA-directed RNA polymerase L n=1 Tax=Jingmen Miniopterus schreibersii paramyxovirus 1 TaxID=2877500 RepID=A0AAE9BUV1_9MONO|nr:RNA polymerase [Jingmen Miniopterus schreibersii paramyxovirus 1]
MQNLNDIIYPESHLDSPLVAGKLIELLEYAGLPHNQPLNDQTLLQNIAINKNKNKRTPLINTQLEFRQHLLANGIPISRLNHVPYPSGNKELFRLSDSQLTRKLQVLLKLSNSCYSKISPRLVALKNYVETGLGLKNRYHKKDDHDIHTESSMINLHRKMEGSRWYHPFLFWFTLKTDMRQVIKQNAHHRRRDIQNVIDYDLPRYYIQLNRNLVMILNKSDMTTHYLTNEMVLMFCDVAEGRLMIDLAMSSDIRYKDFLPRGQALWEIIDSLFIDLGNNTYNIVAMIEPLTLGYLQLNDKSPILKGAFLKYALDELISELRDNGINDDDEINTILEAFNRIFELHDIHMVAEYFSFFRTFGHPILEASDAATKVREHMNKPKIIDFKVMMKGHALFCGFIINGFRDRHGGSWPPLKLPDHATKRIKNAQVNNEGLTDEMCIENWKSFVGLKFECFMGLSLDDDLTMYMKDKALAALKSEWDSVYPKETMIYNPPAQTSSRRLVETFLSDSEFDPVNLINYVITGEYLTDPEFNISYSLKEKEIKKVGRLFAKMTYKMRACQVVAESLIANGVGKFFKENGMAKDEHELLKTLHRLSVSSVPRDNKIIERSHINSNLKLQSQPKTTPVTESSYTKTINNLANKKKRFYDANDDIQYETMSTFLTTDLQKFCLNWRQETSNIFAERLNEIYGLPGFFNWMHKRLELSVLYVSDPHCPPNLKEHIDLDNVPNDQLFIKYPMGGIEGYCQKLWTISTIPFLFLSAYEVGTKIAAVVQGDNQAIAITRRVHPNLSYRTKKIKSTEMAQKYFNQLRLNMAAIGHNLKANETIVSSHFFVYSKRIYYDGLVLSQALKPLSRVVFWSETLVDETRSACSNISTAISKSIEQGFNRWIGYSLNILKVLQQLVISLKFTINPSMTDDIVEPLIRNQNWLISAAIVPSQLGGFNYMNMCRLYLRNIGDPVTASIADIKRMIKVKLLDDSIIQKIMHQETGNSDYLDWASDPYSINIPSSQSVTVMLKNITARTILSNSDNPMLQGLFHFDFDEEDRDLARFLLDRPVVLPRAAHEIMDNSLTGARQEIAGMLDTTKGLIRNSIRLGGIRPKLVDKLSLYDYEQFRVFTNLMRNKKENQLIKADACSVQLAITLRKKMWFHLTQGRPIYGLEVPDTIEVVTGIFLDDYEDCELCVSNRLEYGWFFVPKDCELDTVSKESNQMRVPYFGSTTDERSEIKLSHVRSPSRALRAAIRIAMVYTWAFGDTDTCWEEAWYLASFRANVDLDELKAITPISTSNNIAHRLRDKSTQMKYSSSTLSRVGRYTVISNDNLNFTSEGNKIDTNLIYQQIMLMGLSILEDKFRFLLETGSRNTLLHLHINTSCCIVEMNEHPYIPTEVILPEMQHVNSNKLIYDDSPIIDKDQVKIHNQLYRSNDLDFPNWTLADLNKGLSQALSMTIIEIITKENRDHLNEFKVLALDDDVNSLITEFLLVNPSEFTLYLGLYIAIHWSFDIYYRRPEGKYQMQEFLSSIMTISPKSNFRVLANALSHPSVLRRFWDSGLIEPSYGPNLLHQDFIKMSIDLLIGSYTTYMDYWLDGEDLEYMITESDDVIVDQRFEITQARHLCFLSCLYLPKSEMPIIRGMTSIEKCAKLTSNLEQQKAIYGLYQDWNLEVLPIVIHPASLTYVRRGTVKHIKLRNYLSAEAFGYDKAMNQVQEKKVFDLPMKQVHFKDVLSYYYPANALATDQFSEFNFKIDITKDTNRWESHALRRIGYNSTSCYKAVEISSFIATKIDTDLPRLFLGEGSGSMMATYYLSLGPCTNYYNSGVSTHDATGQRVLSLMPSEYALVAKNNPNEQQMMNNLKVLFNGKPESTWIGNMDSFKCIMNTVPHNSCALIHSDMESSSEKDDFTIMTEQLHILALSINLSIETGVFVTKLAPRFGDKTNSLLNLYYKYYSEVTVFIPASSNPHSTEIYIICFNKKINTLVYPEILLEQLPHEKIWETVYISEIVLNLKLKKSMTIREQFKYKGDYTDSNLMSLTQNEKILLSYGFKINGPRNLKYLSNHDVGSGEEGLRSSINIQFNNIVNLFDTARDQIPFFDPYPIQESSKLKELMEQLTKKILTYYLIYSTGGYATERSRIIKNLRRKSLMLDLNNPMVQNILNPKTLKKYKNLGFKRQWIFAVSTVEIKLWWKVVGYSLLLMNPN